MRFSASSSFPAAILAVAILNSCSPARKIERAGRDGASPSVSIASESQLQLVDRSFSVNASEKVSDVQGREALLMKATVDDNGEVVAQDEIEPAIKVENFRNVAERGGGVDLKFTITAPPSLTGGNWQLRFEPFLAVAGDTAALDRFFITGEQYRKAQLRAYERYERWLRSLVTDSTEFIDRRELEIFLQRLGEIPEDEIPDIVDHYTDHIAKEMNARRAGRRDEVYGRMVRCPIQTEALKLDTVITGREGTVTYEYVQRFSAKAEVRKVELILRASAYDLEDRCIAEFAECGPLTYYISSLSTLAIFPPERASDSVYVRGYELLRERNYREAISLLAQYGDFNSALLHCALNYDDKALRIAEALPSCARVEYLKAILYARKGDEFAAYSAYTRACNEDGSYVYRGNLDPEITRIKRKYNINH